MTAVAVRRCTRERCYVPERECAYGELDYSKCPNYIRDSEAGASGRAAVGMSQFPWTGNALGLDDVNWLSARGRPKLLAPIGPHNAGKTTFLVSAYLGLLRGLRIEATKFAGTFTFGGWESLAAYLRYPPDGIGPTFPPHTAVTAKAAPGMLHIAARGSEGVVLDFLLADAPGEWFRQWAINEAHAEARGARWVANHADAFLLFVDSDALSGPDRGTARDDLFKIALRLSRHIASRPVAIVWAKADKVVPTGFKQQIEERLNECFPSARVFPVSALSPSQAANPQQPFLNVISWLAAQTEPMKLSFALPANDPSDPFLAFRGDRV